MKEIVQKIKDLLHADPVNQEEVIEQLKVFRQYFIDKLNEPGLVKMIRMAYEDIESNGEYTFRFLEEDNGNANLEYLVDLLSDYGNKYNKEELLEIRDLMEGIERTDDEDESEE